MAKKKEKEVKEVVEAEVVEEQEEKEQVEERKVMCMINVGMFEDGGLFFDIGGEEKNLVYLSGLLEYAKKNLDAHWQNSMTNKKE